VTVGCSLRATDRGIPEESAYVETSARKLSAEWMLHWPGFDVDPALSDPGPRRSSGGSPPGTSRGLMTP